MDIVNHADLESWLASEVQVSLCCRVIRCIVSFVPFTSLIQFWVGFVQAELIQ